MHRVKITDIKQITHNVRRYRLERPEGYSFKDGEATEMALDRDGWRDNKHPFTFTGLAEDPYLEFTIKSYPEHDGMTKRLGEMEVGETLLMDDPWVTMPYHGPGTFIAGGAGLTPMLAVLRRLEKDGKLEGHRLIFSNTAERDIILRDELEAMKGLELTLTVTNEKVPGLLNERLDRRFFEKHVDDLTQWFYLCGPDPMTSTMATALVALGAKPDRVIIAG